MVDVLFWISAFPVIILAWAIYKADKNKEPTGLLVILFFSGLASIILTLILSQYMEVFIPFFAGNPDKMSPLGMAAYYYIMVALIEEFSKWIMIYLITFKNKEFDEVYDAIVYGVFVALGFAFFENLLYVFEMGAKQFSYGVSVGILRAIFSVPGHAFYGVFIGYYLGLAKLALINKNTRLANKNKFLSLFIPVLLHGTYDYLLSIGNNLSIFIFLLLVIFLYASSIKKIKQFARINIRIDGRNDRMIPETNPAINSSNNIQNDASNNVPVVKYCSNCGQKVTGNYCSNCGKKIN